MALSNKARARVEGLVIDGAARRLPPADIVATVHRAGYRISESRVLALIETWLERAAGANAARAEELRALEVADLDRRAREIQADIDAAREGYARSQAPIITTRTHQRARAIPGTWTPDGRPQVRIDYVDTVRTEEQQPGDPHWLDTIARLQGELDAVFDRRTRLLGIERPAKVALTDPSGDLPAAFSDVAADTLRAILRAACGA